MEKNIAESHNGHEFVDLGLPSGLLWATCNVGATSPEQTGLYFAWGETTGYTAEDFKTGKALFDDTTYKAKNISSDLALEQDAAHVCMGGKWRMPTKIECKELIMCCSLTLTKNYNGSGIAGCIFKSKKNGKSIFIPASGYIGRYTLGNEGLCGYIRTSSLFHLNKSAHLYFDVDWFTIKYNNAGVSYGLRCYGLPVRGVCKK